MLSGAANPPAAVFYSTLYTCGRLKMQDQANLVMADFRMRYRNYHRQKKSHIYNAWIYCIGHLGRRNEINDILDEMIKRKVPLDIKTFMNALTAYHKAKDVDGMLDLCDRMRHPDIEVEITADIYNVFLDAASKAQDVDLLHKFFEEMLSLGLKPNTHSFNIVLRTFCDKNDIEKAENTFSELVKTVQPDQCSFNTLMSMYKNLPRPNLSKVLTLFEEMSSTYSLEPNVFIYNTIIHMFSQVHNTAQMQVHNPNPTPTPTPSPSPSHN